MGSPAAPPSVVLGAAGSVESPAALPPFPFPPAPPEAGVFLAPSRDFCLDAVPLVSPSGPNTSVQPPAWSGRWLFLELFAGSAGLSKLSVLSGFSPVAVDHAGNRFTPRFSILEIDALSEHGQALIRRIAVDPDLVWAHIATQCGTFSRAREKRLPKRLRKAGVPDSPPLRSDAQPRGLNPCQCQGGCLGLAVCSVCKGLSPQSQERVAKANTLAAFSAEIARLARRTHPDACVVTIENPRSSLLWHLEEFIALAGETDMMFSTFQACMLGGDRDKWIGILHNSPVLAARLAPFVCDGQHTHKPWGWKTESEGWNTADTAAYPDAMSMVLADAVKEELLAKGTAPATAKPSSSPMASASLGLSAVSPPVIPPGDAEVSREASKRTSSGLTKQEKQRDTKRRAGAMSRVSPALPPCMS